VKVTDEGVPLDELIEAVKSSVTRAGVSRASQDPDFQVTSVQLVLKVVAAGTSGGSLDFRVPFIGMRLKVGATVTRQDTHTIDLTLTPPEWAGRQVRGGEDVEEALVNAVAAIRAITAKAAEGDDPWIMSEGTVDISFVITQTGTISLGVDGELSGEVTQLLRLQLAPT
jgi:Trypsin-co-occurring domain 2